MTATYAGVYRQRATLSGPNGRVARVMRVPCSDPQRERYIVANPRGDIEAVCWRHGVPDGEPESIAPHYDGGWTRALAIAEQCAEAAP